MQNVLRDIPSSAALTPEPVMDTWEEHQHLMNPMFLQSPDEIDLPPLDPELLEHRRHQVRVIHVVTIRIFLRSVRLVWKVSPRLLFEWITSAENLIGFHCPRTTYTRGPPIPVRDQSLEPLFATWGLIPM